jgi:hypothetical protein
MLNSTVSQSEKEERTATKKVPKTEHYIWSEIEAKKGGKKNLNLFQKNPYLF